MISKCKQPLKLYYVYIEKYSLKFSLRFKNCFDVVRVITMPMILWSLGGPENG